MSIFYGTVRELHRSLTGAGIFRNIQLWWLDAEGPAAKVYSRAADVAQQAGARRLLEVPGSRGRTLVLFLSDCVSEGWYDGRILSVLDQWSQCAPVALLQMLPERMWPRTALGDRVRVSLRSSTELQTNSRLRWIAELPDPWMSAQGMLPLPVASLDPASLYLLTRMIAGEGLGWVSGFLFDPEDRHEAAASPLELAAAERISRFLAVSSAQAVRLATLLAASPILSLGVLRLLRREFLPEAGTVAEAEVLLGGILRVRGVDGSSPLDPEGIDVEFLPGVRPLLLDNSTAGEVLRVLERTTRLSDSLGFGAPFFELLLADPAAAAGTLDPDASPLARHIASVLNRLGGPYARIVHMRSAKPTRDIERIADRSRRVPMAIQSGRGARAHILLADNDRMSLRVWGEVLRTQGYAVTTAPTASKAKTLLDQKRFDLAVLDLRLVHDTDAEDDSGLRLAEKYGNSVPVIILSGAITVKVAARALHKRGGASPAVALVEKSNGPEALLDAVRKAIRPKVFISHGHDRLALMALSEFLTNQGVKAVTRSEQLGASQSFPESLDRQMDTAQFAVVLMTPDDAGARKGETLRPRARQNLVFELGYLLGRLGSHRIVVLLKEEDEPIELPSNDSSIQYLSMDPRGDWRPRLAREIKASGIELDITE